MNCKKLIEVAMPVKEVSAESVRDKSIRHGHISTLHLWWARRPLPVCRAVVFASLVPDPLDENCPQQFKDAVKKLLSGNTYKPYEDIPFTAAADKMEDNPRNRLLMFIGKFSQKFIQIEKTGEGTCPPKETLDAASLIKWENKNNEHVLNIARKLIFVAQNCTTNKSSELLFNEFDSLYQGIKDAEKSLYNLPDRHLHTDKVKKAVQRLDDAIESFLEKMPKVYDPFAGGGAIPLEAARLGCRSYANDLNPVAHIIEKASLEFPQKYGKPIYYSKEEFIKIYGKQEFENQKIEGNTVGNQIYLSNRLAFDINFITKKILKISEKELEKYYPCNKNKGKPLVYIWARVAECSNPSCKAEVPLLRQFYLSKKRTVKSSDKYVYLNPKIVKKSVEFEIKKGANHLNPFLKDSKLICPICGSITESNNLKTQYKSKKNNNKLLAILYGYPDGHKEFEVPEKEYQDKLQTINVPKDLVPEENMLEIPDLVSGRGWGITKWRELFSDRQLLTLTTLINNINIETDKYIFETDYKKAVAIYLAILIDRIAARGSSFGIWHIHQETVEHPFGRQALPMVFDYPELNPFSNFTGNALDQLKNINDYLESENENFNFATTFTPSSSDQPTLKNIYYDAIVTDPPYYDAIAYSDLSDYFYIWLKKSYARFQPDLFYYPLTPKSDECTALKYHHNDNMVEAKHHFEAKLFSIFTSFKNQIINNGIVSIMFAHQSTEAWITLCNSILNSHMNITGSWSADTEVTVALKAGKAFLASSVTVSCIPSDKMGIGDSISVKNDIVRTVRIEVNKLFKLGFRGADLLTACFGPAVSEFGKYEKVEKASGEQVTVEELLTWARDAAFNAIVSDIATDDYTRFYIGWLNLFGFSETEHDDVRRITQIGLNIDVNELLNHNLIIRDGNKQTLATFKDRSLLNKKLGDTNYSFTIDKVHKAMYLLKGNKRNVLLGFINENASNQEDIFWRVCNSLKEVLPKGMEDHQLIAELIANKDNLIKEAKGLSSKLGTQEEIFN